MEPKSAYKKAREERGMIDRTGRKGLPRMREAYPQLDIVKAMSALSRGETRCLFYGNPMYLAQGLIEVSVAPGFSQVRLDGAIAMRNLDPWTGPTFLDLVPNPNGVQRDRRAMLCPECERRCQVLTWVGSWRCRTCDGLLDQRQLIDRDTRLAEELRELERQLSGGRRKGQHQAVFDRLVARAGRLARELQGRRPRMAAPEHRRILHSEWMSIAESHRRTSLGSLSIPSEEGQRRPEGWLEDLEAKRLQESAAGRDTVAAASAPVAKALRMSPEAILGFATKGDDPDEVSDDM
jgi:hypothetical protein